MIRSILVLLSLAISLSATVINVPADQTTIQAGIDAAVDGDTVLVDPGIYSGLDNKNVSFDGKEIIVKSTHGADTTIIDCQGSGRGFAFYSGETNSSVLDGFTIINGDVSGFTNLEGSANGDGIACFPLESNNFGTGPSPIIKNCIIKSGNNVSLFWAHNGSPILENCLFIADSVLIAVQHHGGNGHFSDLIIQNCTLVKSEQFGIRSTGYARPDIINSIIYSNELADIQTSFSGTDDGSYLTITYSRVDSTYSDDLLGTTSTVGNGNIHSDPLFIDSVVEDYNLRSDSPSIDAGDPTSPLDPDGSLADLGAYPSPYGTPVPIVIDVPNDYSTIQAGLNAANERDTVLVQPGTYYENIIWPETNGIKLISAGDSSNTIIDGQLQGTVIRISPLAAFIDSNTIIENFQIISGGNATYGGGLYIKNAAPKLINIAINNCSSLNKGGGIYLESSGMRLENARVCNNNSIEEGGGIYMTNSSPVLKNVTINQNTSKAGGGLYLVDNSSPVITGCSVSFNTASYSNGGGIFMWQYCSPQINNTEIIGNHASSRGGGVSMVYHCDPIITNVKIQGNDTNDRGGGVVIDGHCDPIFQDVDIIRNSAKYWGGGLHIASYSYPVIRKSIIALNYTTGGSAPWEPIPIGGGIHVYSHSSPTVRNSTIFNNHAINGHGGGVYLNDQTSISIDTTTFVGNNANEGGAVYVASSANCSLGNVNIIRNLNYGIYNYSGTVNFSGGNIFNNIYAIFNSGNSIDASNMYWGINNGPYHQYQNSFGTGDSVNVGVNISPWLFTPNIDAPPIPIQNVRVTSTGNDFVNLSWDASPLGDLAGYQICFKTDSSEFFYTDTINVSNVTSHSLTGLAPSITYYLTVICYDTDGNESWYSQEVSGTTRVMEVQNLDIAGNEDLFHLITHDPLITFDYFDSMGETQTNYHVQISTDSTFESNLIWDSGELASGASSIQYTEAALQNGVKYYLRARVGSGSFWSEWSNLAFGMNTEPSIPVQVSLIGDEVTTSDVLLEISNSSDAEGDNLSYDFRLYDATQTIQLDSAIAVVQDPEGTEWEVTIALDDNAQHWWTVQAFDGYEYSELAGPVSFLINLENDDPAGFDLTSPLLDEAVISQSPLFTWNPAKDPDPLDTVKYVLYLDTPDPGVESFDVGIDTSFQLIEVLDDNTSYNWKVIALDLNDSETENTGGYQSFTVNTSNDLPEYFELLYPVWDEMVVNLQPEFLWEASSDPDDQTIAMRSRGKGKGLVADQSGSGNTVDMITGYDFYLSTDSMLADVVPVEVVGTYYSPEEDLLENQTYFWAVSALDDSGGVTFSDTASFWTNADNEAPEEFALLLPTEGEVLTVLSPTFTWEPSSDPDLYDGFGYHILLGSSPEDMDTLWSGEDTTLTLDWELEDNMTYYWSVFAEDWNGLTTFNVEGYQSFTINQGNDSPSMVELITPDSVIILTLTPEMYWTAAVDADPGDVVSYEMHWWGDGIEYDSVLSDTNAAFVTSELEDNTQYFWEVIAMDQTDGISHSEPATFWTDLVPEAPEGFALLSPENDAAGLPDMPSFQWELAEDPDPMDYATYTLQIASDSSFSNVVFETNTNLDVGLELTESLPTDTEYWWRVFAIDTDSLATESEVFKFTVGYVSIADVVELPTEYILDQNYPNPFNPSTTIRYGLPEESNVSLVIYDVRGQVVQTLESGPRSAGWYDVVWNGQTTDGKTISTGIYFARLVAGDYSQVVKMLYLK
ncbi:MAG: T9SS type A sorting domain-containing protein [Candidatus Marinimicrobia bacterium]|nr:T9SS type A sorting domain-containing protein [Candidatus Neomarinimicrobiota bacterium]